MPFPDLAVVYFLLCTVCVSSRPAGDGATLTPAYADLNFQLNTHHHLFASGEDRIQPRVRCPIIYVRHDEPSTASSVLARSDAAFSGPTSELCGDVLTISQLLTAAIAVCSEFLVGAAERVSIKWHVSEVCGSIHDIRRH